MRIALFQFILSITIIGVQAVFAAKQTVAVLPSDGEDVLNAQQVKFFTDNAQEIAVNALPPSVFDVVQQNVVIRRLGGFDNYVKECKESSCIVELGKKAMVDYVAQCSFGKLGSDLTVTFELYNVSTEGLIDKFVDKAKNTDGLLAIMQKKIPSGFMKIPGAFSRGKPLPPVAGGIRDLESSVDYVLDYEKRYLASISTEPQGAALSFDGLPEDKCSRTPCKTVLSEGSVRIIARLEQYETADTTVSITRNEQDVAIKLKPNFGVLEIKPAYSDSIGRDRQWSLAINDKSYSFGEIRLSPGSYEGKLRHECYEDIGFEVGINKGGREIYDMPSRIKLKKGGLVLSTEKDGEPVSQPVFVDGKPVGETPFSDPVAVCSEIAIGFGKEKVNVKLEHKQTVRHVHKVQTNETFTDKRDGKKYKIAKIGNQTWMAENLNYDASGSKCYDNKPENCKEYGRLYDWNAAMKSCPSSWHLPSKSEYEVLGEAVGGEKVAGKKLKAKSGWNSYNGASGNGTDAYGFSALPGGNGYSDGSFSNVGNYGDWWSSNESNASNAYSRGMNDLHEHAYWSNSDKSNLFSVRCLLGPSTYEPPTYEPPTYEPSTYKWPTYEPPAYGQLTYEQPSNKSFWVALALDIAGMAFVYYGYETDKVMVNRYEYYVSLGSSTTKSEFDDARAKVEDAKTKRNVYYILGSIFLATGIGVHIWF